jgi:5-methylcytosine-specific restriction protein A
MATWIFQANPTRYNLLADWSDGAEIQWAANQHRGAMQAGDLVYFRLSGREAGLYATGTILSSCFESPNEYGSWKVNVRYDALISPPLLRSETDAIAEQFDYGPLVGREATNFLVPEGVQDALANLLSRRKTHQAPSLGRLSSRKAILAAIKEYDDLGKEAFLHKYGFGESRSYVLVHDDREYDSKAIVGVACKYEFGVPLTAKDFSGGQDTVQKKLEALGFRVRTSRRPPWLRDEVILALDLYVRHGALDDTHPEVRELSNLLNGLPLHPEWRFSPLFRNPNGVSMKLQNLRALDPSQGGMGLKAVSQTDREVWNEFHDRQGELFKVASAIRAGASAQLPEIPEDDEEEAPEGRILTRIHRSRERNRALVVKRKLQRRRETGGALTCEACDFDFSAVYGDRGEGFAECHHRIPLAESGSTKTRVEDLAVLCANCHRMIHVRKPLLTVEQLRQLLIFD